jgi:hypothetical protein
MIKIKFSTPVQEIPIIRQTPGSRGVMGNCQFFVNEPVKQADWWVVGEGLAKNERVICPPENTILITQETDLTKEYDQKFVNQFNWVITSNRKIKHPHVILTHQGYGSYLFMSRPEPGQRMEDYQNQFRTYDELESMTEIPKTKLLSVVASEKTRTEGAKLRRDFIVKMKEHFKDKLDIFSNKPGVFSPDTRFNKFKWDSVAPYKYHLAIENSVVPHYWTDKILDAYLAGAYPIYYGHPNVTEYFSPDSMTIIDIKDIPGSIATIENVITGNYYEKHIKDIWDARKLVLEKYNIFQLIADEVKSLPQGRKPKRLYFHTEKTLSFKIKQSLIEKVNKIPVLRDVSKKIYRKYKAFK